MLMLFIFCFLVLLTDHFFVSSLNKMFLLAGIKKEFNVQTQINLVYDSSKRDRAWNATHISSVWMKIRERQHKKMIPFVFQERRSNSFLQIMRKNPCIC